MRRATPHAFTLVEILVALAIIALLAALLFPALNSIRSNARAVSCKNNLSNIGRAMHAAMSKTGQSRIVAADWTSVLLPYLAGQESTLTCPEFANGSVVGYGMNNMSPHFGGGDGRKIIVLDYAKKVAEVVGPDIDDLDRAKRWDLEQAPRHAGQCNVLYFDSHVETRSTEEIDPVVKELHDNLWMPYINKKFSMPALEPLYDTGLLAEYRIGATFDGPPTVTRLEPDLNLPWGGGRDAQYGDMAKHPFYELRATGDSYFCSNHTSVLRGQIKADYSENYRFRVSPDDSVIIVIDGKEAVPYTWYSGNAGTSGTLCAPFSMLADKWVDIEVRHMQQVRTGSHLWVKWSSPSTQEQMIPSKNLRSKKEGK